LSYKEYRKRGLESPLFVNLLIWVAMDLRENIKRMVEDLTSRKEGVFLVDVIFSGGKNIQKILVLVDNDEGVNIDSCAYLSKSISAQLDLEDLIDSNYVLEVSSPGLDHPLKQKRQYVKNIGRLVSVNTRDSKTNKGRLLEVRKDSIVLSSEPKGKKLPGKTTSGRPNLEIPFNQIEKTRVLVSFK